MGDFENDIWPFHEPKDTAVVTTESVINGNSGIVYVTLGGRGWQFIGEGQVDASTIRLVTLEEIFAMDSSLAEIADLQAGWEAWRTSPAALWNRRPKPNRNS